MHLVVFDIDGTLVDSDGFDGRLYAQAVRTVLGVEIDRDWSRYRNVTDSGILDEILDGCARVADRTQLHGRVRREFVRLTREYVARRCGALCEIPGARAFVEQLLSDPRFRVAVATGGWRETAMLKLSAIGLNPQALPLATASDSPDRREIMQIAERRAMSGLRTARKTYFGDGAWDQKAAAALDYEFIGVGGRVDHFACVSDLSDRAGLLARLVRPPDPASRPRFEVVAVTLEHWDLLGDLFARSPGLDGCWCMWPLRPPGRHEPDPAGNEAQMRSLLAAGKSPGLLALADRALGWCATGPRGRYPQYEDQDGASTFWAIPCIYVDPAADNRGAVASALIAAAIEMAARNGAEAIDGPPSRWLPGDADAIAAATSTFRENGFVQVGPGSRMPELRLALLGGRSRRGLNSSSE